MTARRWRLTGLAVCGLGTLGAVLVLGLARTRPLPTPALSGCEVTIAGRPVSAGSRPDSALEVGAAGTVVLAGTDAATTSSVRVQVSLAPDAPARSVWNIKTQRFGPPASAFQEAINVQDYATYGIGLTVLTVRTDNCAASVWIRVSGRPPVFTAFGVVGFFLGAAGFVAIAVNLWRSAVGASGTFAGALGGGLPYGIGVGLLAQQAGAVPLGRAPALAWIVLAGAVAGGLHLSRRMLSARRARRREARLQSSSPTLDDR